MSPYQSAGARWLSEDEGGDTAKKGNRFSDEEGSGRGPGKGRPATNASSVEALTAAVPSRDLETTQETSTVTGEQSTSVTASVGRSRVPSEGLLAAKAHWKAMEGTGRGRLRRANSQEGAVQAQPRTNEGTQAGQETPISGHPIATEEGVPMPSLRTIAPMGRTSQGVPTYQGPTSHPISTAVPSASPLPLTHDHSEAPPSSSATVTPHSSFVPDFAMGYGGDGISGHGIPSQAQPISDQQDEEASKAQFKRKLLPQLKAILTCDTKSSSQTESDTQQHQPSERNEIMYYPPPLRPEACPVADNENSDGDHATERGGGVPIDFTISKVLIIILRELEGERFASVSASSAIPKSSALGIEADAEDDGKSSGTASDEAADSSFEPVSFSGVPQPDPSFLPSGDVSSRPRNSRRQGLHRTDSTSSKRRRSSTVVAEKDPSTLSPPHKRNGLSSGLPGPQPRQHSYSFEKELALTLECDVCTSLFYEPMTTPCGHTFCSRCLARSLDHSTRCPVCRQDLPTFSFYQDHPVNKLLASVVITAFHEESMERQRGIEEEERDARLDTPIFVCALAFPGMPTILHVFEPRYRLMLRRCVESGRPRFGMVLPARGTGNPNVAGIMEYGTMLDIKSIQMLPDGRSMVETVGSHRFRLLEKGSLDGYTVGRVERIDDISSEDEAVLERLSLERARSLRAEARQQARELGASGAAQQDPTTQSTTSGVTAPPIRPSMPRSLSTSTQPQSASAVGLPEMQPGEVEPSTEELMATCRSFIDQLRSGSAPWLLQRLNNTYGPMPEDPSLFSFWMALVRPSLV
ncbi:hypothetical protein QFC19_008644 [Naganishia cerealis]|uniref:Uncharacterized protein n=1 Tax=Naganishia cerealis TaxID=610337 RepID=A0ACC2V0K9_9TREE|nr:hypothetical protein QFC19_008644 [Naganishia cerealis]